MLAGKKSADSQLAGNFPTNVAGKWNFSYHPAGSAEQIFFSQQQKKIVKKALKAFTYHFYGLFVTFCENVSLGAPEMFMFRTISQPRTLSADIPAA